MRNKKSAELLVIRIWCAESVRLTGVTSTISPFNKQIIEFTHDHRCKNAYTPMKMKYTLCDPSENKWDDISQSNDQKYDFHQFQFWMTSAFILNPSSVLLMVQQIIWKHNNMSQLSRYLWTCSMLWRLPCSSALYHFTSTFIDHWLQERAIAINNVS